jgi:hypothetical protein
MIDQIGITFPLTHVYGQDEQEILQSTKNQIEARWPLQRNLLINLTWFGPQFENNSWSTVQQMIKNNVEFDNLFLVNIIDPVYITEQQINDLQKGLGASKVFKIGLWEHSAHSWHFHPVASKNQWKNYSLQDVQLTEPEYIFICYQRKPRRHRIELTNLLIEKNLHSCGLLTLGGDNEPDEIYGEGLVAPNINIQGNLPSDEPEFGTIPNDLTSLGSLHLWQRHFLNVVSECEFNSWHPLFVTEKTWKPIVGMRPFVIHGQPKIYSFLENNGFKTFNHLWSHIPCATGEDQHGNVVSVIDFLRGKSKRELHDMYNDILPDLEHNRNRFFEFAQEQKYRIDHIFT